MGRIETLAALLVIAVSLPAQDPDRDGDGLSDFQEIHKYGTDPAHADSDHDGTPDGDWNERREWTYSVRVLLQVRPPYDLATMNDDYQDVRVLEEHEDYLEFEAILYPLNTCRDAITGRAGWRRASAASLAPYLAPGVTTNWDDEMRVDLSARLRADGIDLDELTDKDAAAKIAKWALRWAEGSSMSTTWAIHYPDGRPAVHPDLRNKFRNGRGDASWSMVEQFQHELFGKGMFDNRSRGTCTSSANYLTTVLRAAGVPTRMILAIPLVDASDPANCALVERLRHHRVRDVVTRATERLGGSFAAHTFNEVWVDGRWRRLNYESLGANILDGGMGLMVHVHTFNDHADAGLIGWGLRKHHPSPAFRHNNPYTALTLSDRFGEHAKIANPRPREKRDHRQLTVSALCWFHDDAARPASIGGDWGGAQDRSAGHLLLCVDETNGPDGGQYHAFFDRVDKRFRLTAPGQPPLRATATRCWWAGEEDSHFYVQIHPDDYARMKNGVDYELQAESPADDYRWIVAPGLSVVKR